MTVIAGETYVVWEKSNETGNAVHEPTAAASPFTWQLG